MRVRKLSSLIILSVAIFALFNILPFVPSFFGGNTQNHSVVYADGDQNGCSMLDLKYQDKWQTCVDDWAKSALGLEKGCGDWSGNPVGLDIPQCNDGPFGDLCVFRCLAKNGDQGITAEQCADSDHCALFPEYPTKSWPAAESKFRSQCDNCLDNCWYNFWLSGGSVSEGTCQQEGIHGDGNGACRAYPPDHADRPCATNDWITAWTQHNRPIGIPQTINRLCDIGIQRAPQGNTCKADDCKKARVPGEATVYLDKCGAKAEDVNKSYQDEVKKFFDDLKLNIGAWVANTNTLSGLVDRLSTLCIGNDTFCGKGVEAFVGDVINVGTIVFGGLAMLKILFGGVLYATAAGNPGQITTAKEHIKYALIGIVLILGMNILLALLGATPY